MMTLRAGAALGFAFAAALGACHPARSPASSGSHAQPAVTQSTQRASWAIAYRRECRGSITPPRVAPSGAIFTLCRAAFDLETGTFRDNVPIGALALLDDELALFDDYSAGGVVLGALGAGPGNTTAHRKADGGVPERAVVSADGRRAAILERSKQGWFVVLRELPSLRSIQSTPLPRGDRSNVLAFIDDGDPIVLSQGGVFRATAGELVLLGSRFEDVTALAASTRRALVVRKSGARELVALPGGERVLELPPIAGDDESRSALAIDARGTRFAYHDGGLRVVELVAGRAVELHHAPSVAATSLVFSPDGKWLLAESSDDVVVLGEGAQPERAIATRYPAPPKGFRASMIEDGVQTFTSFESSSEVVWANQIARYQSDDQRVDVTVFASDAAELGRDGDLTAWVHAALGRYEGDSQPDETLRVWRAGNRRSLEYASFVRDGCDPVDRYVRLTQDGGTLYRVVVEVPPGTERGAVGPLLKQFFDVPLGAPPSVRRLAVVPPPSRGPC